MSETVFEPQPFLEVLKQLPNDPDYFISSLGYVLNLKTGKGLWPTRPAGQVTLRTGGISKSVSFRALYAEYHYWDLPEGTALWPVDGNPDNNTEFNLRPTAKKTNVLKETHRARQLLAQGMSEKEVDQLTGLGLDFISYVHECLDSSFTFTREMVSSYWMQARANIIKRLLEEPPEDPDYPYDIERDYIYFELRYDFREVSALGVNSILDSWIDG